MRHASRLSVPDHIRASDSALAALFYGVYAGRAAAAGSRPPRATVTLGFFLSIPHPVKNRVKGG